MLDLHTELDQIILDTLEVVTVMKGWKHVHILKNIFTNGELQLSCTFEAHWRSCCIPGWDLHYRVLRGMRRWNAAAVTPWRGKSPSVRGTLQHKPSFLRDKNKQISENLNFMPEISGTMIVGTGFLNWSHEHIIEKSSTVNRIQLKQRK